MCNTVGQCCCFISWTTLISFYLLLLLLDVHIERIIDSYHERNIYDHCSALMEETFDVEHPFNEIHEVMTGDDYHYHYYEKNSDTLNYKVLQNTICRKIYWQIKRNTHDEDDTSDKTHSHKEMVHETYVCNEKEHGNTTSKCNHCIYYESTSSSLQWTKCKLVPNQQMDEDDTEPHKDTDTTNKLRRDTTQQFENIKADWSNYSRNLSEFANKMRRWSSELSLTAPFELMNQSETAAFVYIENETCVEGSQCQIKQHCVHYDSTWIKWEKCRQIANEKGINGGDSEEMSWSEWADANLMTVIVIALLVYVLIQCESEAASEKIMWKTRAYQCHSQYNAQPLCAICYETLDHSNEILLRCGHKFHQTCLNKWEYMQNRRRYRQHRSCLQIICVYLCRFKRNHKCPSCNRKYSLANQKFVYQHQKYKDY
eukprot:14442_1